MQLKIQNGQFIDSETGKVVKPEFGNREQIQVLTDSLKLAEKLATGIKLRRVWTEKYSGEYEIHFAIDCPECEQEAENYMGYWDDKPTKDEIVEHLIDWHFWCSTCDTEYTIKLHDKKLIAIPSF